MKKGEGYNFRRLTQLISILGILFVIGFCIYGFQTGIFTKIDILQKAIKDLGIMGPLLFIMIQIVQVIVPVIPGGVTLAAGVVLFGPWFGFFYNYVGIITGSIIAFMLARNYGKPFIHNFVSEQTYQKYEGWLEEKHRFHKLFTTAMFLPGFPDDFICMLAGLTKMPWKKFVLLLMLAKPACILAYSFGAITIGTVVS